MEYLSIGKLKILKNYSKNELDKYLELRKKGMG